MRRLYTAVGACNRCYGSAGSLWLLKKNKDFCVANMLLKVVLIWFNNALRAHTTKMVCKDPLPNRGCSQGRLNGHKVPSPPSSSPGDWGVLLALFHKKATIFLDPNREFLRSTGRAQPVCLLMHQTKLSSQLLMEHVVFPCKIQHPLQWYPFPSPWFLMQNLKGK